MIDLLIPADARALRRNNFDAIRLAMALLVVWSHSFALWFGTEAAEPLSRLTAGTYNSGNVGVLAFFAISGFLITLSWTRARGWRDFLRRRIARIVPGYLVAITLCSLIVVPAFSSRPFGLISSRETLGLASNLLLRNYIVRSDAFGGGAVNGSLWSIPFEFWCYLGVMGLGLAGLLRWRPVYPLGALAVMATRVWLDATGRRPGGGLIEAIIGFPYLWFTVLPPFLLGGAIYCYRDAVPRRAALAIGLVVATLVAAHLPLADPPRTILTQLLMPPTLVYLIFYAAFSPALPMADAARFGDFSYGTYLYAFPVQQMLLVLVKGSVGFYGFVLLSLPLSLAAGVASWHLIERRFLPRLRRAGTGVKAGPPLGEEAAVVAP